MATFKYKKGDLLQEPTDAIVNTVNTIGVMGKGLALQFKERFPLNYKLYRKAAESNLVEVGKVFITATQELSPFYIINFPTKKHWKEKSKLDYIKDGLDDLVQVIQNKGIKSLAIPPLGCGLGGLKWSEVKPLIEKKLGQIEALEVVIFEPSSKALGETRNRKNKKMPQLTPLRAMLLDSFVRYRELDYRLTMLEAQKIVYFLQRLGNDFQLEFEKHIYGPYADKLKYVLDDLDGHYIHGMKYRTAKAFDTLELMPEVQERVKEFIKNKCTEEQKASLKQLYKLMDGYESPLGMELLASVDFIISNKGLPFSEMDELTKEIHGWTPRKEKLMKPNYISVTAKHLQKFEGILY